jgi:hypothetical protein
VKCANAASVGTAKGVLNRLSLSGRGKRKKNMELKTGNDRLD